MELNLFLIDAVLMPSAAETEIVPFPGGPPPVRSKLSGELSCINPIKTRGSSSSQPSGPTWRIDGGEGHIGRFFATPDFAVFGALLRVDVFIPPNSSIDSTLRHALQLDRLFRTASAEISKLAISDHLVRALEHWSSTVPNVREQYLCMPFGSSLIVRNIHASVADMEIYLQPNYELEAQLLSVAKLQLAWGIPLDSWPPLLDLADLSLIQQIHESISLVHVREKREERVLIFKSNIEDPKYLYHELKILLTLEPHPNIIERPIYVVTKRCRFGGKIGVCGFILEYHLGGSLENRLRQEAKGHRWPTQDKVRCAEQITSAMLHVNQQPLGFYSDLKLNNIVLASNYSGCDAILIDFEQRGGLYAWEPPEIFYTDILDWAASFGKDEVAVNHYQACLRRLIPDWKRRIKATILHAARPYNTPWLCLTPQERESAQVFMLGKVLWCIFEGTPDLNGLLDLTSLQEDQVSLQRFPQFQRSPVAMRDLIMQCTTGAFEHEGILPAVTRRGDTIFPRHASSGEPCLQASASETQESAKFWWQGQLAEAVRYVEHRASHGHHQTEDHNVQSPNNTTYIGRRPTLQSVLESLQALHLALISEAT